MPLKIWIPSESMPRTLCGFGDSGGGLRAFDENGGGQEQEGSAIQRHGGLLLPRHVITARGQTSARVRAPPLVFGEDAFEHIGSGGFVETVRNLEEGIGYRRGGESTASDPSA